MRNDTDNSEQQDLDAAQIQALLKDYPAPEASAGFYDQALARAIHAGTRRRRNRRLLSGFGGAIAAGLVLWLIGGPVPDMPDAGIPGVTMTLEEPRTVNLVFASATALDTATLTVTLPAGIELAGFPGQREISWETSLDAGRNLLPLKLFALTPAGGELLARLEHDQRNRVFRLQVTIS